MNRRSIWTFALVVAGGLGAAMGAQREGEDLAGRVAENATLAARVQRLLPPGASLQASAAGFHDEGEFIATLHLSRNLNIPFYELKAKVTGAKRRNLTTALRNLRPELRSSGINRHVKRAEQQARADLQQAGELAENTDQ